MAARVTIFLLLLVILKTVLTFVTTLRDLRDCDYPEPPYGLRRTVTWYPTFYDKNGRHLVRGNLTVLERCVDCRYSISVGRQYYRKPLLRFKSLDCRHFLIELLHQLGGMAYEKKNCTVPIGTYNFNDVDVNDLDRVVKVPFRMNGTYKWIFSMYNATSTQVCWNVTVTIEND